MIRIIISLFFPALLFGQSKPNIIFLLADDMGNGEISFISSTYSTPNIDSLAHNGAYFSDFHVAPICTPTRYRLMTGKYGFRGNLDYFVLFLKDDFGIEAEENTLPEQLQSNGYVTGFFGKWHLGSSRPKYMPVNQGFDYSWGAVWAFSSMKTYQTYGVHNLIENQEKVYSSEFATDTQTDKLKDWISLQASDTSTPFFAYMAYTNPHDDVFGSDTIPYKQDDYDLAPIGYSHSAKQKWANLKNMDNSVGEIVAHLENLGIDSNTIIIFTSDNGGDSSNAPDNSPYSGNKRANIEGGTHVPMIWYQPGKVDSMQIDSLTAIEDFLPTLVEGVAGGTVTDTIDGISFYPLLSGGSVPERYWLGAFLKDRCWSVLKSGGWKLTNNNTASITSNTPLSDNIVLYNYRADPSESTDLSITYPVIVSELQGVIDAEIAPNYRTILSGQPNWSPPFWGDPVYMYNDSYPMKSVDYKRQ